MPFDFIGSSALIFFISAAAILFNTSYTHNRCVTPRRKSMALWRMWMAAATCCFLAGFALANYQYHLFRGLNPDHVLFITALDSALVAWTTYDLNLNSLRNDRSSAE